MCWNSPLSACQQVVDFSRNVDEWFFVEGWSWSARFQACSTARKRNIMNSQQENSIYFQLFPEFHMHGIWWVMWPPQGHFHLESCRPHERHMVCIVTEKLLFLGSRVSPSDSPRVPACQLGGFWWTLQLRQIEFYGNCQVSMLPYCLVNGLSFYHVLLLLLTFLGPSSLKNLITSGKACWAPGMKLGPGI